MIRLTFLGHLGWCVSTPGATILIDPIIRDCIGTDPVTPFAIYPERAVFPRSMPHIDAVILSSEHFQSFDPRSLAVIAKFTDIVFVSSFFSCLGRELLQSLGLNVRLAGFNTDTAVCDLIFKYLPPLPEAKFFDTRSSAVVIGEADAPSWGYVQSTSAIVRSLPVLPSNWAYRPSFMTMTANWGWGTPEVRGEHRNLFESPTLETESLLRYAASMLPSEKRLGCARRMLICGGGYGSNGCAPPAIHHKEIEEFIGGLALNATAHALAPGDQIDVGDLSDFLKVTSDWIRPSHTMVKAENLVALRRQVLIPAPIDDLVDLFRYLSRAIAFAPISLRARQVQAHCSISLGPKRICIQLRGANSRDWVFDMSTSVFSPEEYSGDTAIRKYPFGLILNEEDAYGLVAGRLCIAEVLKLGTRQWFVGSSAESLVEFLYNSMSDFVATMWRRKRYDYLRTELQNAYCQ